MALLRLENGAKIEIAHSNEEIYMMRNRLRNALHIVFNVSEDRFEEIRKSFTEENLSSITIYFSDNELESTPDEQLIGVSNKVYEKYTIIGNWINEEINITKNLNDEPPLYKRQLSVYIGQTLYDE